METADGAGESMCRKGRKLRDDQAVAQLVAQRRTKSWLAAKEAATRA